LNDFISRAMKSLLVVEPDTNRRNHIWQFIGADDVQITSVADTESALQMLRERRIGRCHFFEQFCGLHVPANTETLTARHQILRG